MKAIVFAALAAATLLAVTPAPQPSPSTQAAQQQPPPPVPAAQFEQVMQAYQKLAGQFQIFQQSVYEPYCYSHKGFQKVALMGASDSKTGVTPAWPAVVSCKDGNVQIIKSPLQKPI